MRPLLCLISLSLGAQSLPMGSRPIATGTSYLVSESFEGASACGNGSQSNCSVTWTQSDTITSAFNYATAPAPLEGSYSLRVTGGASIGAFFKSFTAQDTVYFYFIVNHTTLVGGTNIFGILDGSANMLMRVSNANPEWLVRCGDTTAYSTAITQGTTYHVWGDYTKGTGANAVCHLYTATTSTKPGSAGITITTGTSTGQATYVGMMEDGNNTAVTIFDKIRVSTSAIGSNPS
jgi:hypothetical protein